MPHLFSPLQLRGTLIRNRVAMAPMCMYSAKDDGIITDWHLAHYLSRATGGVGLLTTEATSVEPRGRNSWKDLGLWDDSQIGPFSRVVELCKAQGAVVCCQLGHSGRKAFGLDRGAGPFKLVAPSAIPYDQGWVVPHELTIEETGQIVSAYTSAAGRALQAGFDCVEIHAAHGFLLHQFLSGVTNHRRDKYGGSLENRARMLLEVVGGIREKWPEDRPVLVKLSCLDWEEGGLSLRDQIQVIRWLHEKGTDIVDCSTGHITAYRPPEWPGYQVPYAEAIRREVGIPTMAVGLISSPELAEEIICNGRADMVVLARELLRHPHWTLDAARALRQEAAWPEQYRVAQQS